jgi:hypothetical protein
MKFRAAWLVVVWGLLAGSAGATPITYNLSFTPSANNPAASLAGTITTDGTLGAIGLGNITAWSFTESAPVAFTLSSSDPGTGLFCITFNCGVFTATPTTLSYDFSSQLGDRLQFQDAGPNVFIQFADAPLSITQLGYVEAAFIGQIAVYDDVPNANRAIIGTAGVSAVPEPGTLVLLGLGLSAFSVRRRRS